MASVDFHCKCKGGTEAKAIMRHNDKEERVKPECEHANPHLDKSKSHLNLAYKNVSYAEAKEIYDKRILELDATTNTNKRSDRVTMFGLEIPRPPKLEPQHYQRWFNRVCNLVEDWVGSDNFIEGYFHVDEVHDYYDPKEKIWRTSVEHAHLTVIPEMDGKLNGKAFSSKARMTALNNEIEKMTTKEFGVHFKTGKGKRGQLVEEMKQETAEAMKRMGQQLAQKEIELNAKSDSLDRELEERTSKLEAEYSEREAKLTVREDLVEQRENEVSDIKKSLKTQISALQDIYDRIEAIDETGAKRRWNYLQQHAPQVAEKVDKAVSKIEKRFNPNTVIDHRSETEQDRDLTR